MRKLRQYENAPINNDLKRYAEKILEHMKTGMTLSISIQNDDKIGIIYYKN